MAKLAPIALFVYKRPEHTRRVLQALARNPEARSSDLYVFADGPKPNASAADRAAIREVARVVRETDWCRSVHIEEAPANRGLAASLRGGINRVLDAHDRIIVLEDDIETSAGFLAYMNQALELYAREPRVMSACGYLPATSYQSLLPPTFFHWMHMCWGWGTWRRAWETARWDAAALLTEIQASPDRGLRFDFDGAFRLSEHLRANRDGRMSTWAVFWGASIFLNHGLCLFPGRSLVRNIGFDGSGEHCGAEPDPGPAPLAGSVPVRRQRVRQSFLGQLYLKAHFSYGRDSSVWRRFRLAAGRLKHRWAGKWGRLAGG